MGTPLPCGASRTTLNALLNDIDRLDIDTEELEFSRGIKQQVPAEEKIVIPENDYSSDFWHDHDGGVGG